MQNTTPEQFEALAAAMRRSPDLRVRQGSQWDPIAISINHEGRPYTTAYKEELTEEEVVLQQNILLSLMELFPGTEWEMQVDKSSLTYGMSSVKGPPPQLGGLYIEFVIDRRVTCERVVVDTETVVEEVPDPEAPKVRREVEKEIVEWRCHGWVEE